MQFVAPCERQRTLLYRAVHSTDIHVNIYKNIEYYNELQSLIILHLLLPLIDSVTECVRRVHHSFQLRSSDVIVSAMTFEVQRVSSWRDFIGQEELILRWRVSSLRIFTGQKEQKTMSLSIKFGNVASIHEQFTEASLWGSLVCTLE